MKELIKVAEDQDKYENQYLHEAKKWVFCDANVLNIYLYSCHTYQVDNIILKEMSYKIKYRFDYIFFCDNNIKFDSTIKRPKEEISKEMHNEIKNFLEENNIEYTFLSGSIEERWQKVKEILNIC